MMVRGFVVCLVVACSLWACSMVAPTPQPAEPGPDEALPASVERFIEPTPAMLAAALAGEPLKMQAATAQTSCQAASTCPAGFGACTTWSAPSQCSATCTESPICTCPIVVLHPGDPPPEPCVPDLSVLRGRTTFNSFRVCFNSAQQACTEWKQSVTFSCGC